MPIDFLMSYCSINWVNRKIRRQKKKNVFSLYGSNSARFYCSLYTYHLIVIN